MGKKLSRPFDARQRARMREKRVAEIAEQCRRAGTTMPIACLDERMGFGTYNAVRKLRLEHIFTMQGM